MVKNKKVVAFLDGDRGGALNLKKLMQTVKIDYVAIAPPGKEVEDLKLDEIKEALENKKPVEDYLLESKEGLKEYRDYIKKVVGQLKALIINEDGDVLKEIPVSELVDYLSSTEDPVHTIVMDGIVTQRLLDVSVKKGVKKIVGLRKGVVVREPAEIEVLTFGD